MHFLSTIAALAATVSTVQAGKAWVYNHCNYPVYLWAVDIGRNPSAVTVPAGGSWNEDYHTPSAGGVSVKISKSNSGSLITQFEYTLASGTVWYDGSNINCNNGASCPFTGENVLLVPSVSSCPSAACPKSSAMCSAFYNQPTDDWATHACTSTADTAFHVCLPDAQMPGGGAAVSTAATTTAQATVVATRTVVAATSTAASKGSFKTWGGAVANARRKLHETLNPVEAQ